MLILGTLAILGGAAAFAVPQIKSVKDPFKWKLYGAVSVIAGLLAWVIFA